MLRTFAPFLAAALVLGAEEPSAPKPEPLYSVTADAQDIEAILREFAKRTQRPMSIPDLPTQLVTLSFQDLPFEKALDQIVGAGRLEYRKVDGVYVVGLPIDLHLRYPSPDEQVLDATYRCRRISADSLAMAVRNVLPELKVSTGALFLSPTLEGNGSNGGGDKVNALRATDVAFRTHDVLFSGPPDMVRRAMAIAQKFDRPRKEVRINIRVVSMDRQAETDLGISWMSSVTFNAVEQVPANSPNSAAVPGIRLGSFSHTPLNLSATLNALESKGRSKTLSNPTVTLLDGERSFILNGERYMYPRFTGKDQNGQSIYDVGVEKIGVYLQVGVQIGLDNDMVLSLYPQVSSLGTPSLVNGAEYPTILTSEEQTTVRASSGETLVLGGLMQDTFSSSKAGIPFLSRLPFLGRLFSSAQDQSNKQELMIILTPELVDEAMPKTKVSIEVTTPQA
jgi:type II secretory pathway component GspD/PulD (secretin)